MKTRLGSAFAMLVASILLAPPAQARTIYCCRDARGMEACSDILPAACQGRAYREVNERGITVKRFDPPLNAEQRAQKEAEAKRVREEELQRKEQERRNRALLATYASEKDIDSRRDHDVAQLEKAIKASEVKYDEAVRKKRKLADEAEFYKKKGMPPELKSAVRDNEADMNAQLAAIEARKKEIEAVKARYEEDRSRYRALTVDRKPAAAARPADAGPR